MDVRKIAETFIRAGIKRKSIDWGTLPEVAVAVEIPRIAEHGDFSTNAALRAALSVDVPPAQL